MSGAAVGFVETMPMTEPRRSFRMHSIAYSQKVKQSKSLGNTKSTEQITGVQQGDSLPRKKNPPCMIQSKTVCVRW
jgi:hypothetical protein